MSKFDLYFASIMAMYLHPGYLREQRDMRPTLLEALSLARNMARISDLEAVIQGGAGQGGDMRHPEEEQLDLHLDHQDLLRKGGK